MEDILRDFKKLRIEKIREMRSNLSKESDNCLLTDLVTDKNEFNAIKKIDKRPLRILGSSEQLYL
jgi:hypothetical protein